MAYSHTFGKIVCMLKVSKKLYMPDMYKESIEKGKDASYVVYQRINGTREEYSFNYLNEQATLLLEKMKNAGLKKGDRVAVISSLRPWWFPLHYACLQAGYIMVCIDPGIPAVQMQKMMFETEVRAVFTSIKNVFLPKELEKHIPIYSIEEGFPLISKREKIDSVLLGDATPMPEDTFYVLFSSGTTNENRKAVLLPHSSVTKAIEYCEDIQIGKDYANSKADLMLFPPYHIAGLFCINYDICYNTKIIILERLTPKGLVSALQDLKPDIICTVPSMLTSLAKKIQSSYSKKPVLKFAVNSLLNINGFLRKNLNINIGLTLLKPINKQAFGGNLKCFMIGASPIDETTNKFYLDMGLDVAMCYGLTELGAPLTTTAKGYYPGTAGKPLRKTEELDFRIVNKDETDRGEVEILSPFRMTSYLRKKDNEGIFTEDGYFRTGDLGYINSNGCLVICGRIKESIVLRNGEKLLPEEIESKYQGMDSVQEVCAFKIPGEGGCDDFAIAVTKIKQNGIQDEAIKTRIYERAEHLPQMYRPKDVYVIKEFPLSSSHKIQRFRLTEMAIKGESDPVTDATMIPVDEDETTSKLRKILTTVGGVDWKTKQLSQGTLLNLDSLSTVDLYVAIQEQWDIDLFQSSSQPETFGELLDVIKNFDAIDKNDKTELDLSQYPKKASFYGKVLSTPLTGLTKTIYNVKGYGAYGIDYKASNYLFCSNHRTALDPIYIKNCLPKKVDKNTCVVGKAALLDDKLFGTIVSSNNFIPIDRTGNSIQTLDRCRELLLEGWNIIIFPEGTNVENHTKLYPLKDGAAKLSIATNKPIVPVYISGVAQTDKEQGEFFLPPFNSKIRVKFGEPIYPKDMSVKELNELLTKKIEELN